MSLDVLTINFNDKKAGEYFHQSLKRSGFAIIENHPIPYKLIDNVYDEWKAFFDNSLKNNYLYDKIKQDGYFPFLTVNAKGSNSKDLKEFYHLFSWGRLPELISPSTLELFHELTEMATELLNWIQIFAPNHVKNSFNEPLKEMIADSQSNLLRIIHYPPIKDVKDSNSIRAAAHEDINLLTMLVAGTQPGLQVLDLNQEWHDVSCDPSTIIVNSGDMLKMASEGYYPSTTHRVINPQKTDNRSRYSMPLFLHPRDDIQLNNKYTAGSYLKKRLEEIGLIN